ncbi:MAG: 50S ribosomal protein L11 methyltransferase [Albidovulum sp.]|nr:50S ribosomal protein L11 methyltransferase [Albidovulum sp.]
MRCFRAWTTAACEAKARELAAAVENLKPAPCGVNFLDMQIYSGQWEVGAYFLSYPDTVALALLAAAFEASEFRVEEIEDNDWVGVSRSQSTPFRVGRFTIMGGFDAAAAREGIPIAIESSMAFGTGRHGSTKGCLEAFEGLADQKLEPKAIADIGCGSAILAIAAAHIWPASRIVASDSDPSAVEVARANLKFNRAGRRVEVFECAGFSHDSHARASPYGLIAANILLAPLLKIAPQLPRFLASGGRAVLSGILPGEAPRLRKACVSAGLVPTGETVSEGWATLVFRKPK